MSEPIFETERLLVRHFEYGDLDDFAALCADPAVMRYVGDGKGLPRSEVERWIGVCHVKYATRGYGTSAVFEKANSPANGQFIGYCGVVRAPENDFDELIYVFNVSAWGKGYATEVGRAMLDYVFARSSLDRIYATIDPDNSPSIKVAGKLGFRFVRVEVEDDGARTGYHVIERGDV